MQNPCAACPLLSLFGTVYMGQTIQTLDVLALYNLFMGTPARWAARKEQPMPPLA